MAQDKTTIYIDPETRDRLKAQAEQNERTTVGQMRWLLDNNVNALSPFERAYLYQVVEDQGLASLVEAISYVIHELVKIQGFFPTQAVPSPSMIA